MPYRKNDTPEHLVLPSNPDYWIDLRRRARRGDRLAAQEAMLNISTMDLSKMTPEERRKAEVDPDDDSDSGRGVLTEFQTKIYFNVWALRLIEDWNIDRSLLDPTDASEEVLPITVENLDLLDDEDSEFLQAKIRERIKKKKGLAPFGQPSTPS